MSFWAIKPTIIVLNSSITVQELIWNHKKRKPHYGYINY